MPKAKKLHTKGKPTSLQKQTNLEESPDPDDTTRQFQLELCWCIQQLEKTMSENKGNEKQMQETWKVLTVLKNNNQPIIRKRQLMRTHFGDYRQLMASEEKKLAKSLASKMKITESTEKPKATFLRKSTFLTTGNDAFRFNFQIGPDQEDSKGNTENTASEVGNNKKDTGIDKIENDETAHGTAQNTSTENGSVNNSPATFKFTYTDRQFKFNFNTDDSA